MIELCVILSLSLCFSVPARWYYRIHTFSSSSLHDSIAIVTTIRKQIFCCNPLDQGEACTIRCGTLRITTLTGIPNVSTARCNFVLSLLLCGSCLDYHLLLQQHADEPWCGWHQSSATHNLDYQSIVPIRIPKCRGHANGKIGDVCSSNYHWRAVNHATEPLFLESRIVRW